jgi:hypothetical protein
MSKLEQAIKGAETRLPHGYAVVLAIKHGEMSVYLNVCDTECHGAEDKDLPIHEQVNILVEEALLMRGPRAVCIFCENEHDNFTPYCDECLAVRKGKDSLEVSF